VAHNWLACSRGSLAVLFLGIVLDSMRRPSSDVFLPWSCDTTWILHRIHSTLWLRHRSIILKLRSTNSVVFQVKVDEQHWKRVQMIDGSDWQAKSLKMTSRLVDPSVMIFDPTCAWRASIDAWLRRLEVVPKRMNMRNAIYGHVNVGMIVEHENFGCPTFSQTQTNHWNWSNELNKTWRFATWFASHMNWT
jgi:hypothetical protein